MSHSKGRHPGAVWKKCDFQIHTPRDTQWSGARFGGGTPDLEAAREQWADDFIGACIARGLGAIAITDHHEFCFVPYIQRAVARLAATADRRPWLFPGIEVTCTDSVQCIVLFDVDTDFHMWNRLFGGHLPAITEAPPEHDSVPQADLCGKALSDFVNAISGDTVLALRSIVLPHGGDASAHKSLMRRGFHDCFQKLAVDGVYTDGTYQQLDSITIEKIYGKIEQWGTRRRGIITTSDNRQHDFAKLGTNDCWVKLGEPSAEAIRQVLLADEARIAYTLPSIPLQRVLEFHVNSTLCGSDFELLINDGFTAIIGGRGSGKSAVLEYLRFGLGRSTADVMPGAPPEYQRQRDLISETLGAGFVKVTLERDGVVEQWTRSGSTRDAITVTIEGFSPEEISISAAQQRFRARAFSQKQLSTLVTSVQDASVQITGIAAAEEIDQRQVIEAEIARAKRQVISSFDRLVDRWAVEAEHNAASSLIKDLLRRIEANKKKLEDSGLSVESQNILDEAPLHNSTRALIAEAGKAISSDIKSVQDAGSRVPSIDLGRWAKATMKFDEADSFVQKAVEASRKLKTDFASIQATLTELETSRQTADKLFGVRLLEFGSRYQIANKEQSNLSGLIAEASRLSNELQDAEINERKSKSRLEMLGDADEQLRQARASLAAQLAANRALLGQAALKVSSMSGGVLRAEVKSEAVPQQYVNALTAFCESNRVREASAKCEERVVRLLQPESGENWTEFCDRFVELCKSRLQGGTHTDPNEKIATRLQSLLFDLTEQQLGGIYAGLSVNKLSDLLTATPVDYISFEYRDRDSHIPFEKASHGQQASALLNLLLHQEAGTLIIDQPEDDLDNKVIMRIVNLVRTAKRKRQLIFATHNANFVVNGDADKVVSLVPGSSESQSNAAAHDTPRIQIEFDGAIETPKVRAAITDTVEGGKEAFELRGRKYQFKSQ